MTSEATPSSDHLSGRVVLSAVGAKQPQARLRPVRRLLLLAVVRLVAATNLTRSIRRARKRTDPDSRPGTSRTAWTGRSVQVHSSKTEQGSLDPLRIFKSLAPVKQKFESIWIEDDRSQAIRIYSKATRTSVYLIQVKQVRAVLLSCTYFLCN